MIVNNMHRLQRPLRDRHLLGRQRVGTRQHRHEQRRLGQRRRPARSATGITYTANTIADPRFVDRRHGNFHLQAGSPAIDTALIGYALTDDLDGAGRPQGAGPDIGTYER